MNTPKQGQSLRSVEPTGYRIKFDPAWSQSKPFCVFAGGTAANVFETLHKALARCQLGNGSPVTWAEEWA